MRANSLGGRATEAKHAQEKGTVNLGGLEGKTVYRRQRAEVPGGVCWDSRVYVYLLQSLDHRLAPRPAEKSL